MPMEILAAAHLLLGIAVPQQAWPPDPDELARSLPPRAQSIDEWTVALKNTRDAGLRPVVVVVRKRDFGPSPAFSVYRQVDAAGWRVRRDVLDDEGVRTAWAPSADGPALPVLVENLKSSSPRLEFAPAVTPPRLGETHTQYRVLLNGWTPDNEPLEAVWTSLGSSFIARWMDEASTALAPCWTQAPPPHAIASEPR